MIDDYEIDSLIENLKNIVAYSSSDEIRPFVSNPNNNSNFRAPYSNQLYDDRNEALSLEAHDPEALYDDENSYDDALYPEAFYNNDISDDDDIPSYETLYSEDFSPEARSTPGPERPSLKEEEILEIPLMRMMAKNDFEGALENAQDFINQYPNSPTGHYFKIRAYQSLGMQEEAESAFNNSQLPPRVKNSLYEWIQNTHDADFTKYWQTLRF